MLHLLPGIKVGALSRSVSASGGRKGEWSCGVESPLAHTSLAHALCPLPPAPSAEWGCVQWKGLGMCGFRVCEGLGPEGVTVWAECEGSVCWVTAPQMCRAVQCSAGQCSSVQGRAGQCSAGQCRAGQCSAVQCSAVQASAAQRSAAQGGAGQCSAMQGRAGQCRAGQGRAGQCSAVQRNAGQGSAVQGRTTVQCRAAQGRAGQCRAGECSAVQCSAGQGRAGQSSRAGQGRAGQCSAVQGWAGGCRVGQGRVGQCRAGQGRAVQYSAVQCSAVQGNAGQCRAVQCRAVQGNAGQCRAVQCRAVEEGRAVQGRAGQGSAGQGRAAQCSASAVRVPRHTSHGAGRVTSCGPPGSSMHNIRSPKAGPHVPVGDVESNDIRRAGGLVRGRHAPGLGRRPENFGAEVRAVHAPVGRIEGRNGFGAGVGGGDRCHVGQAHRCVRRGHGSSQEIHWNCRNAVMQVGPGDRGVGLN